MANFMRTVVASIIGMFVVLAICVIIPIATLFVKANKEMKDDKVTVENNAVFQLKLSGTLVDHTVDSKWGNLNLGMFKPAKTIGLSNILAAIKEAKKNKKIKGIVLQMEGINAGYASMEELRDALLDFKKSNKFLVSYANNYNQNTYYLASCADKIYLNPKGSLALKGLALQKMFLKDLFDKLDLKMQIAKVGTYKSYVEQYSRTDISPESRSQDMLWLNNVWDHIANQIAVGRNLQRSQIEQCTQTITAWEDPNEYLKSGLVDGLIYPEQLDSRITQLDGDVGDHQSLSLNNMEDIVSKGNTDQSNISVYYCQGEIGSPNGITAEKTIKQLERLRTDDQVKAVVFRVNSPGGSAYESEQIWHEIQLLREQKPVVVSMGDVAASGGYYISCGANAIVAHNTTITGSIGIFGVFPCLGGVAKKLGVTFDEIKTHEYAASPNAIDGLTPKELGLMQSNVTRGYQLFTQRCYTGRSMTPDSLEAIAQGRVWSGAQGKNLGLVDAIGGVDRAITIAANLAKVGTSNIVEYPNQGQTMKDFMNKLTGKDDDAMLSVAINTFSDLAPYLESIKEIKSIKGLQARIPYEMILK